MSVIERLTMERGARGVHAYQRPNPYRLPPRQHHMMPAAQRPQTRADMVLGGMSPGISHGGGGQTRADRVLGSGWSPQAGASGGDQQSIGSRGMGLIIDNPITKSLLKPLNLLATPMRGIALANEEFAKAAPEWLEWVQPFSKLVDEDRVREDTRSNMEKLGDPEYGWGQILKQVDTGNDTFDKWANRATGLVGDIALDPLSYLTFGAVPAVRKGASATTGLAARAQRLGDAADVMREGGRLTPGVVENMRAVGRRGINAADSELLDAMNMNAPGVRFKAPFRDSWTPPIPGSEPLARGVNRVTGSAREAWNQSRLGTRVRNARAPQGLEDAYGTITTRQGSNDKFLSALTQVQFSNLARRSKVFQGLAARELDSRMKGMKEEIDQTPGGLPEYIRMTEDPNGPTTVLNELSDKMREIAAEMGVELPELHGLRHVPHILSAEFKQLLNSTNPKAIRFRERAGITTQDSLRESGFLSARQLTPHPDGTPKVIDLGDGQKITIADGSIDEINDQLRQAFPELRGSALETDPQTIFERYILGVSNDVGLRYAAKEIAGRNNPFIEFLPELAQRTARREHGGADPWADDRFYRGVVDKEATTEANQQVARQAESTLADRVNRADDFRGRAAGELDQAHTNVVTPLRDERKGIGRTLKKLEVERDAAISANRSVGQQRRAAKKYAEDAITVIEAEIKDIGKQLGSLRRRMRRETAAIQRQNIRDLNARLNQLRDEADALNRWVEVPEMVEFLELKRRRDEVLSGVRAAQEELDRARQEIFGQPVVGARQGPDAVVEAAEQVPAGPAGRPLPREEARGLDGATDFTPAERQALAESSARRKRVEDTKAEYDRISREARDAQRVVAGHQSLRRSLRDRKMLPGKDGSNPGLRALTKKISQAVERVASETGDVRAAILREAEALGLDVNHPLVAGIQSAEGLRMVLDAALLNPIFEDISRLRRLESRLPDVQARLRSLRQAEKNAKSRYERAQAAASRGEPRPDLGPVAGPGRREQLDAINRRLGAETRQAQPAADELQRQINQSVRRVGDVRSKGPAVLRERLADAESELGLALQGEGTAAQLAAQRQAAEDAATAPLEARRAQLRSGADEVPDDLRREMDRLDEEGARVRAEIETLTNDRAAMEARRAELTSIIGEAPQPRPRTRWDRTGGRSDTSPLGRLAPAPKTVKGIDPKTTPDLHKLQPLDKNAVELETVMGLNTGLDDEVLTATEALLHSARRLLEQASINDIKAGQARAVLNKAKKEEFVDVVAAQLRDHWRLLPGADDIVVSAELDRMMKNIVRTKGEPTLFGNLLTAFTNFFKTYATMTPGFHVRNAMSAIFMNSADGVSLKQTMDGYKKWREFAKHEDPLEFYRSLDDEWRAAFDAAFASGTGGRFMEEGIADASALNRTRGKEAIFRNRFTRGSQRIGQNWAEGPIRLGMAIDTVRKGGSVDDALSRITRIHFDYSQVSTFDETAKKLIPFWTFMSRNLPMQMTQMWMKPARYVQYESFVRNMGDPNDEFVPEYITRAGGFDTGLRTPGGVPGMAAGMDVLLQPDWAHSRLHEDMEKALGVLSFENPGAFLSDFNPLFTAPIEYIGGRDLFTGRQYTDQDWRPVGGILDRALLPLYAVTGQTQRTPDGQWMLQEKGVDALRSLNPLIDRTSRLIPQTAGGQDSMDRQAESWLRFFGAPIRTISEDQKMREARSRMFNERDLAAMQRMLALADAG